MKKLGPVAACFLTGLAGCLTGRDAADSASVWQRIAGSSMPSGPDIVLIEYAILEGPVTDPYLTGELWERVDEQALPGELRNRLNANGLRAGVVYGSPPPRLQKLLESEAACPRARRASARAGQEVPLPVNGPVTECTLSLSGLEGFPAEPATITDAEFGFRVVAELVGPAGLKLNVTPSVRHGERRHWLRNAVSGNVWSPEGRQVADRYEPLTVRVEIGPDDLLVIGAEGGAATSLGGNTFISALGPNPVRRALAIRAGRTARGQEPGRLGTRGASPVRSVAFQAGVATQP